MSQSVVEPTYEVHLPEEPISKFDRERKAFFRLLPELLVTHRGLFVAIHDEQVVDSGSVRQEVVFRTLERVRADLYVALVSDEPEPICRSGIRRVPGEGRPRA